jgi:hypothetical protein
VNERTGSSPSPGNQVCPGGQRVDLADCAVAGRDAAGDLPQCHALALARSLAGRQLHGRAGQVAGVLVAPVVSAGNRGELASG